MQPNSLLANRHPRLLGLALAVTTLSALIVGSSSAGAANRLPARTKAVLSKARSAKPGTAKPKVANLGAAQTLTRSMVITGSDPEVLARGQKALARIGFNYDEMLAGWTIAFLPSKPTLLGLTLTRERRVEIYVRSSRSVEAISHDLGHELGHVIDVAYGSESRRASYLELRGLPAKTSWWACDSCRDLELGAGDFAEVFSQIVAPSPHFYSKLRGPASAATIDQIVADVLPKGLVVKRLQASSADETVATEGVGESVTGSVAATDAR